MLKTMVKPGKLKIRFFGSERGDAATCHAYSGVGEWAPAPYEWGLELLGAFPARSNLNLNSQEEGCQGCDIGEGGGVGV